MRVAYVCADPGIPVFGCKGCSVHVQEVIRAMVQLGATVDLFATRLDGDPPEALEAVTVNQLPAAPKGMERSDREQFAFAANDALERALHAESPFDLVYERYSLWSYAGMQWAKAHDVSSVLEVNAPLIEEQAGYRGLTDRDSAQRVAGRSFQSASILVAVSSGVADYLQSFGVDRERIAVIPNAVNPDRFNDPIYPEQDAQPYGFTVGFLGTLKPWHGLESLVEAFDILVRQTRGSTPHCRLLVVGDGPQRTELIGNIANRGWSDHVEWAGSVTPEDVPSWLARMDVGVAPYHDGSKFYFSPLKVMEYMAAGLPVVTTQVGDLHRLIEHAVTGLLCRPGDPAALAEALDQLRCSSALRRDLGQAGRRHVLKHHTWTTNVKQVFERAGRARTLELCS